MIGKLLATLLILSALLVFGCSMFEIDPDEISNDSPPVLWSITLDEMSNEAPFSIIATPDRGFIIGSAEKSYSDYFSSDRYHLTKINQDGDIIWTQAYDIPVDQNIKLKMKGFENGQFLVGSNLYVPDDDEYLKLEKFDSNGNRIWQNLYNNNNPRSIIDLITTSDGGAVISGKNTSYPSPELLIYKISSNGDVDWTYSYPYTGTSYHENFTSVEKNNGDLSFFFEVELDTVLYAPSHIIDLMISSNGQVLDTTFLTFDNNARIGGCVVNQAGNILLAVSENSMESESYIYEIGANGEIVDEQILGGMWEEEIIDITINSDGEIGGTGINDPMDSGSVWVFKLNSIHSPAWQKGIGQVYMDEGRKILFTSEGNLVVAGYLYQENRTSITCISGE